MGKLKTQIYSRRGMYRNTGVLVNSELLPFNVDSSTCDEVAVRFVPYVTVKASTPECEFSEN